MSRLDAILAKMGPRTALIVRGIPGAGKSHLLRELGSRRNLHAIAFDDFRETKRGYKYDPADQERVNNKAMLKFRSKMLESVMYSKDDSVAIEGVFASADKIARFAEAASKAGYRPVVVTLRCDPQEAHTRGIHGVAEDVTRHMHESLAKTSVPSDLEHVEVDAPTSKEIALDKANGTRSA